MPEVFQTPEKFHITVGVLRIFSQEEEASTIIVHVHVLYAHYMLYTAHSIDCVVYRYVVYCCSTTSLLPNVHMYLQEKAKAVVREAVASAV